MNRREFLISTAAASAALGSTAAGNAEPSAPPKSVRPRGGKEHRTAYFNDARHYWLYAFEPPMSLEEAWWPIDELAGTSINTFIYGVETEGFWSDAKVAKRALSGRSPFGSAHGWRAWHNMQSLIDQGLDPLQVLIDRAHERGLEFITSMRMNAGPRDPRYYIGVEGPAAGGGGPLATNHDFAHAPVRDVRFKWLEELASYNVEGIELDFAFSPYYFKPEEIAAKTAVMTDYVQRISNMVRSKGKDRIVGARVFPTVEMNRALGLDVETWLSERLVDYVAPLYYGYFFLDANMPVESLADIAHESGAEVYPVLQPHWTEKDDHATPAMIRAAVANYWHKGADGMIVGPWFYWPLRNEEKAILTEIGHPQDVNGKSKHYTVGRRLEGPARLGYDHPLPLEIKSTEPRASGKVAFHFADNPHAQSIDRIRLCMRIRNMLTSIQLKVELNGESLAHERMRRSTHRYEFVWLEYDLVHVLPRQGDNMLDVTIEAVPEKFSGTLSVDQVELLVEYTHPQSFYERPDVL